MQTREAMQRLNINMPLRASAIYFKDQEAPLPERIIYVAGNFLVVAEDENDTAPTWYNVDLIARLEGVTMLGNRNLQKSIML